jgi:hypothetical protein
VSQERQRWRRLPFCCFTRQLICRAVTYVGPGGCGVVPLLVEVLGPLAGAQRHLGPASSCGVVVDGRQRSCCAYSIGCACLAQAAALVARLLELAYAVF